MSEYKDVPFVPCNDCANFESCTNDFVAELLEPYDVESIEDLITNVRNKTIREVEQAMYHQCFEVDNPEDMQKWDSGNWFRYKLFENVIEQLRGGAK